MSIVLARNPAGRHSTVESRVAVKLNQWVEGYPGGGEAPPAPGGIGRSGAGWPAAGARSGLCGRRGGRRRRRGRSPVVAGGASWLGRRVHPGRGRCGARRRREVGAAGRRHGGQRARREAARRPGARAAARRCSSRPAASGSASTRVAAIHLARSALGVAEDRARGRRAARPRCRRSARMLDRARDGRRRASGRAAGHARRVERRGDRTGGRRRAPPRSSISGS